jgi:plasmid stability protein
MPAMTVRNISIEAHTALKKRALARGVSAESEVRAMLEAAIPKTKETVGLGTKLAEIARQYGGYVLKIERDKTPARFATFE